MHRKKVQRKKTPITLVLAVVGIVLVSSSTVSPEQSDKAKEKWLPLDCTAHRTVGLHDYDEGHEVPLELYEARIFLSSEFSIAENRTFGLLLDEPHIALYLTLTPKGSTEQHEYSCKLVKGHGARGGYSCTNIPPTDIFTIDPETKRFSRASTGAWTLYTSDDTDTGASLFVEVGTCEEPKLQGQEQKSKQDSTDLENS